jgi:NADPH2:quinone reductase
MVRDAFGGPEVLALREVPDPAPPAAGEIQVRIEAPGMQYVDVLLGGGRTNVRSNYLLIKGIDAVGVRIGGLNEANPALAIANMKALLELAAQRKLKPRISHRFPLERAGEALQAVIDRTVIGKAMVVS